jgi:adenosine 3'-phospho 5'-phosphosulfate transporter B3
MEAIPFGAHWRYLTRLSLLRHPEAYFYMVFFSGVGYIGVTFVLALIKMYGAFIAVTVTSCRKFVTLGLSFVIFPKPITIHYYIASVLVFVGISCHVYAKVSTERLEAISNTPCIVH